LDFAVGTTYSLDLLTLLTVPLSFAWFDRSGDRDGDAVESVEVLGGLQKYAKRLVIFCQAGRIAWPQQRYPQLAFLEESVADCAAPGGGAFHPKVWALRYVAEDGHLVYRMLCLSRNLTTARSWDTILTLDGKIAGHRTVAESVPLADFVSALPRMAGTRLTPEKARDTQRLADELRHVEFECPEGFEALRMWPLGFEGYQKWPFGGAGSRLMVVSPFLALGSLEKLAGDGGDSVLVSTQDALKQLARRPRGFSRFYTLDDRAIADMSDTASDSSADSPTDVIQLAGLHAKLYASDVDRSTVIWTGSANATEAAFEKNVEFLVQLTGSKSRIGIDKLLTGNKDSAGFRDILVPADGLVSSDVPSDDEVRGGRLLESGRLWFATSVRSLSVESHDDVFALAVEAVESAAQCPDGVHIRCWPITLSADQAVSVSTSTGTIARFPDVTFDALTTFLAVEVTTAIGGTQRIVRFVLNLPLDGAPPDRHDRILRSLIKDKSRFARYLWMLLSDPSESAAGLAGLTLANIGHESRNSQAHDLMPSLFELLVRTLDRHPQRLDDIAGLLKSVGSTAGDGEPVLPAGFEGMWTTIWALRERMRAEEPR
jgi:hypothetical protein